MEEIWKDVNGYPDYKVSNLGRVKSFKNNKEVLLNGNVDYNGYLRVKLRNGNNAKSLKIHRLVATAFLGINDLQVNHINGNKLDNNLSNLEFVSSRENNTHRLINKKGTSKYTGVHWSKSFNKFVAQIGINGKKIYLGLFTEELDAHNAYQKALEENNLKNKYA